ncbi:MAG TPA: hypothetical protein VN363_01720 [Anaerolineales bacterium]|nr:hypothetical protein [Anaerolineales bacterium]
MQEWSLRNEIYTALHRWPLILLYGLVGCSLGVLLSFIWPSPWRATAEIYVGMEPYRWTEDENVVAYALGTRFNYADDYKNWQMANLDALVRMDEITLKTLDRLRQSDDFWSDINRQGLADMLQVYWRNPGRWRLAADHTDPDIASAAALAWREVVYETVHYSIGFAQDTFRLDIQLKAIQNQLVPLTTQRAELETALAGLTDIQNELENFSASQAVQELTRWQMASWASHASQNDPIWVTLLNDMPVEGQTRAMYLAWLDRARITIGQDLLTLQSQIDTLSSQQAQAMAEYAAASQASRGLSANLQLEKISDTNPKPVALRPTAQMALVGTIIGVLVWALLWLARLTLRKTG